MANQKSHPDQKYIVALRENNPVVIEEIYRQYSAETLRFISRNNGTAKDAQDIFQEALITIFEQAQRDQFVLQCPFSAYLYVIVRRKWLNQLKKRSRSGVTIQDLETYTDMTDAEAFYDEKEYLQRKDRLFWEKFSALGERCQQLLRLSWKGERMDEVARQMEVSYAYARKKKSECISRLKQLITTSVEFTHLKSSTP